MRLANKTALITGGNSGIGLATARMFAAEGARVAITGRDRKKLDEAAALIGAGTVAIQADVTDIEALERGVAEAAEALGHFDIVFANAGIGGPTPLGQTTLAQFDQIIRTNLTAVFFTVQAALPFIPDHGSVILNGSVHAVLGLPHSAGYAATKAGVRAMTRNFATDLALRGIRVNQVTPGATRTPIWNSRAPSPAELAALEARYTPAIPFGRFGEADELAQSALFLASDESRYITGTEIVVDGGATGAPGGAPAYRG
ncbi:SDR family oxidoreductase [Acidisoma cellulosilytica]|uniref:SDR family oxidoreductase n=1 Tax=Acidisoma cellulosilyticum TaxID=2802395 RepID=A0A963Z3N4_9PROT|nr:SDR family oxidoreductase [Acidisoma cellulosilyticum]MCB8882163.1 SDR family oxidoreductase [Acidisoma cellulosilyticum]